ncbi:MAG: response regulator [Zetaproteobacteria bacterium]|nr:MAG: response regulator [Zetaproteobacteria bacterium]
MKRFGMRAHWALLLMLAVVALMQYRHLSSFDAARYARVHALLERVLRLDTQSEEGMLLLFNRRLAHFDDRTRDAAALAETERSLEQLLAGLQLADALRALRASVGTQLDAIDHFKRDLGIMMNSQRYLATLVEQAVARDGVHAQALLRLNRDAYQLLLEPDNRFLKARIERARARLERDPALAVLGRHVHVMLDRLTHLRREMDTAVHCGTPENVALVGKAFEAFHARYMEDVRRNRLGLIALVLLLVAYMAWLLRHLHLSLRARDAAHARLQEEMAALRDVRDENAVLAMALKHAAEAVLILDESLTIRYLNAAAEALTGYRADELIGRSVDCLSGARDQACCGDMSQALADRDTHRGEAALVTKSGDGLCVEYSIAPAGEDGKRRVLVFHDVTEARERAARLEHAQRLESLGVLAGGIAHDFNNILTAVMGNASLARRALPPESPAHEKLARIEQSAKRAADLCQQMLAYSGKGAFVLKRLDLSRLVREMAMLLDVSIGKQISLRYRLSVALPAIEGDQAQLQQVIMNLITNANEAIGEQPGVIALATGVMEVDRAYLADSIADEQAKPGRYVYLEVSDTGCGMDKDTQRQMFDPFFTTKFTGRGLGMSAMLGIVRGHHGAIRVYSEPGDGTTIRVLFPALAEGECPAITSAEPEAPLPGGLSGLVLVVDDEQAIRELACLILSEMGFDVLQAEDGERAVELFRAHHRDITGVVLDMTMPRMDGKTCYRELCRIDPDVRVILTSGYSEEEATAHFKGKRLAGFIQKPFSPDAFSALVRVAFCPDAS